MKEMNEKMKQLYLCSFAPSISDSAVCEEGAKKFAELIVQECVRVPYDMWDKAELNADVAVKIEHRIKEHFGVEE